MAKGIGLQAGKHGRILLLGYKGLQRFFLGDELLIAHILKEIDLGADAVGLGCGIGIIHIDEHLVLLIQLGDHVVQIQHNKAEAAHDDQTGYGDTDCGEGHKAVEKHAADAFLGQISVVFVFHILLFILHTDSTHPFRR